MLPKNVRLAALHSESTRIITVAGLVMNYQNPPTAIILWHTVTELCTLVASLLDIHPHTGNDFNLQYNQFSNV